MSEGPDAPPEQFGALVTGALALHEMFTSLIEGGFTETQALRIVALALTNPPAND